MKSKSSFALSAAAAVLGMCLIAGQAQARATNPGAPSARELTRLPGLSDVVISPDGKRIAALISADGDEQVIGVWETEHIDRPPNLLSSKHMVFKGVEFIKNDRLAVVVQQLYTVGSYKGHLGKLFITDLKGEKWAPALPESRSRSEAEDFEKATNNPRILDTLPHDPRKILVIDDNGDVYRADVYSGAAERIERGSERFGDLQTDAKGEIRAKSEIDFQDGKAFYAQWIKNPATGQFEEHFRSFLKDRNVFGIVGFSPDPNIVYVQGVRAGDKAGIYEYDIRTKAFLEPAFEHKMFDAEGVLEDSDGNLLGFRYNDAAGSVYWTDPQLAAMTKGLRSALSIKLAPMDWVDPGSGQKARINVAEGVDVSVQAWSQKRDYAVVLKSGPKDPGEYYLLTKDGKLSLLGKARPWIKPETLGDTRLVQYAARDGLMIPAFLTTPPAAFGKGPFPTIVMPHGGPWARDHLGWDVAGWVQYFASRGYAVLQPQFRGSEGWGRKLWTAGDNEWGQKMQDDKDDGAKWLMDQKVADPNRTVMFGYSYGGYSALAATIRPNGLYQCAVSGAGGSLADMKKVTAESRMMREYQRPFVGGLDAIQKAGEAKIPVFLYHGDRDTNVDIKDSRRFIAGLKAANKPYKWLEIKDMGHGYVTMTPAMMETQLVEIEKFFQNECKPGGL
ncbi:alpha/beta hydrolase family protein [Caulobacter radicis]|uniref:S9 family peptidase n=1 Tax=Caulobacter radicis TaxID=2172650 RepID=A0A2T9JNK7_9CAUL|nr:prolyl oligopeptidase family serine peptidase [Caulobacter radicis]PVM85278.1 S9 family peptidase [Caulobacter radicis]